MAATDLSLSHLPPRPATLSGVRAAVIEWAERAGADPDLVEDVRLAVSEAVSNVIEHAYPAPDAGTFDVHAGHDGSTITVTVTDRGRWRAQRQDTSVWRGRGLTMIERLAGAVRIERGDGGTVVTMSWSLRGAAEAEREPVVSPAAEVDAVDTARAVDDFASWLEAGVAIARQELDRLVAEYTRRADHLCRLTGPRGDERVAEPVGRMRRYADAI